eukprot:2435459-Rhodomonas_salina.1
MGACYGLARRVVRDVQYCARRVVCCVQYCQALYGPRRTVESGDPLQGLQGGDEAIQLPAYPPLAQQCAYGLTVYLPTAYSLYISLLPAPYLIAYLPTARAYSLRTQA